MEENIRSYRTRVFKRNLVFSRWLYKKCKDNENEDINIPIEVKNNIKIIAKEKGLYAQVVNLRRNDFKFIAENKNKNEAKSKSQGQSARQQRWFDLDFECIEVKFSPREPDLYKKSSEPWKYTRYKYI